MSGALLPKEITTARLFGPKVKDMPLKRKYMRLNPLTASPLAMSLLSILTGCHLGRVPSPALSMAARAMSAGGLLGTHLLIGSIECVPASIAIRALGKSVNHFSPPEGVVRNRPRSTTSPSSLSVQ
jgi:hypothetical protein